MSLGSLSEITKRKLLREKQKKSLESAFLGVGDPRGLAYVKKSIKKF